MKKRSGWVLAVLVVFAEGYGCGDQPRGPVGGAGTPGDGGASGGIEGGAPGMTSAAGEAGVPVVGEAGSDGASGAAGFGAGGSPLVGAGGAGGTTECELDLSSNASCGTSCTNAAPCAGYCNHGQCTVPPSCVGLPESCGPHGNESCCASPLVSGGTFFRGYDGVTSWSFPNLPDYTHPDFPATVSDFRLDRFEITVGRFRQFVTAWTNGWRPASGSGKHSHLNGGLGLVDNSAYPYNTSLVYERGWDPYVVTYVDLSDKNFTQPWCGPETTWTPTVGAHENMPMACASGYELRAFCIWDGGFLPSEAELGYADSGGAEQRVYAWSNPPSSTTIDCCEWAPRSAHGR